MRHLHLIDTSIGSDNVGDEIIMSEIKSHLLPLISDAYVTTSAGHDGLGVYSRDLAGKADLVLLLGTNALRHQYRVGKKYIWYVDRKDISAIEGKVVLFGVGANRDFEKIERRQLAFLQRVLAPNFVHAVRDETGARIVEACGLKSVNTSCPTLWAAPRVKVDPAKRPGAVCFTLTKHKADPLDQQMLDQMLDLYEDVYFWPQQPRDLEYLRTLNNQGRVKVLPPNLSAYDAFLSSTEVDVVGTRLHGSIRGLHHGRRVLAIAIDNRARDIGAEVSLPTLPRSEMHKLAERLNGDLTCELSLPKEKIDLFLDQFKSS
ncbi:Polysaccharide pyruvyl transferase family protein WcaK [Cognatiyoonia sediminum]|uniref:Polysaccharide pyruvyl transferase family protein WcaK n=1 Tax=Cognatiyoonia sediminum TaxID=1508389 RepID=A0A1M5NK10_9RHOB|nr:polysaccharide pyruvyl transferase family protein [Cognatiyoonia sediminum]SHG89861.1 Polysaccharide pyruvyl transferase family protein WcaK [Cognatiyoonia sediminum]